MTNAPSFVVEAHPAPEDVQFLEDQINTFNVVKTGIRPTDDLLLAIFVREENGAIRAGVFGWTWGGCCEIRYLWVDEAWRGQGYGQSLLEAAEREARRRGCHQVILDTHSFQAPLFYQRNGYEVVGVIDNYPEGYQKYYLKKQLA
ncbi:MAG TPA: GNAT family N-acetyltransferase [Anaerolineales bacterium]|nr:GNAT family N-acetyltransferase [Anaerolineales bacterium]